MKLELNFPIGTIIRDNQHRTLIFCGNNPYCNGAFMGAVYGTNEFSQHWGILGCEWKKVAENAREYNPDTQQELDSVSGKEENKTVFLNEREQVAKNRDDINTIKELGDIRSKNLISLGQRLSKIEQMFTATAEEEENALIVGGYATITGQSNDHGFKNGDIVYLSVYNEDLNTWKCHLVNSDDYWFVLPHDLERL